MNLSDKLQDLKKWDNRRPSFPGEHWLALGAGSGIDALLASHDNLAQALRIANLGLLASLDVNMDAFAATGRRLQAEVLEPLGKFAAAD